MMINYTNINALIEIHGQDNGYIMRYNAHID